MIVLDTNVVSELLRPVPNREVLTWLASQDGALVYFTAIGEAELRFGVSALPAGRRREGLSRAIDAIIADDFRDRVLPFDGAAARAYGEIAASRRAAGRPISQFDCQIAAIARSNGGRLATRNVPDFAACGLDIVDPWRAA